MSTYVPPIPKDGLVYSLKGLNGGAWWKKDEGQIVQPPIQPLKKYLLIMAGQSNCQSSNNGPLTDTEKQGNPKIKSYYRGISNTFTGEKISNYTVLPKGSIGPAIDPLQHHGISKLNSIGFGKSFCEDFLKDHPNSEITIMPCALGGTSFRPSVGYVISWDKLVTWAHKNLYAEMISDSNEVLKQNPDMEVLGCLWHQGESDVGNWEYPTKLDKLVSDMRVDLLNGKGKNMPFICGTMLASWKAMNSATNYIDNAHKNIQWRFNDGITGCSWFDWITDAPFEDGMKVHFDASAQRNMGKGYYATYKQLAGVSGTSGNSKSLGQSEVQEKRDLKQEMSFEEMCKKLLEEEGKIPE